MNPWLRDNWPWFAFAFVIGALVLLMFSAAIRDERAWEAFAAAHHCKVVGHVTDSVGTAYGPVVSSSGKIGYAFGTTYVPGKTGYACDDGVTYWR